MPVRFSAAGCQGVVSYALSQLTQGVGRHTSALARVRTPSTGVLDLHAAASQFQRVVAVPPATLLIGAAVPRLARCLDKHPGAPNEGLSPEVGRKLLVPASTFA